MELKDLLIEYISSIIELKKNNKQEPYNASMNELLDKIHSDIKEAINRLILEKRIVWSPNINGVPLFMLSEN